MINVFTFSWTIGAELEINVSWEKKKQLVIDKDLSQQRSSTVSPFSSCPFFTTDSANLWGRSQRENQLHLPHQSMLSNEQHIRPHFRFGTSSLLHEIISTTVFILIICALLVIFHSKLYNAWKMVVGKVSGCHKGRNDWDSYRLSDSSIKLDSDFREGKWQNTIRSTMANQNPEQ